MYTLEYQTSVYALHIVKTPLYTQAAQLIIINQSSKHIERPVTPSEELQGLRAGAMPVALLGRKTEPPSQQQTGEL